ncbi:MAG: formate--tetrahydrofolate ligase [Lactovum sp.]
MKTDIEISEVSPLLPIVKIAEKINISEENLELYGNYKAKLSSIKFNKKKVGKLVLVTAINPTAAGEGKTTVSIGLSDALNQLGEKSVLALREPSMGPVFGMKGGATGGGYAQVAPMLDINLHFTGDIHAISSANNLISAMLDNHIFHGNELNIDLENIVWRRVMDMNDRALRDITVAQDKLKNSQPRQDHFDITVASEIMAVFCLANSLSDLKERISKILIAFDTLGQPVTVDSLGITDALVILLKDAFKVNLVQTLEGNPAFIHGGPFANIAHGCNSITATQAALTYGEIAVTEAGFGADLGAEKFLDINCQYLGKSPDLIVIVATIRALKYNAGIPRDELNRENLTALRAGYVNLERHIENMKKYGLPVVVAINQFPTDTVTEINELQTLIPVESAVTRVHSDGGAGGLELAKKVLGAFNESSNFKRLYESNLSVKEKISIIAKDIYGAAQINFSPKAQEQLEEIKKYGWDKLDVCIAKTQYSFSDNPKLLGAPKDFELTVRELSVRLGAGFVVVYLGDIIAMPGLPKKPAALEMTIDDKGKITGLS